MVPGFSWAGLRQVRRRLLTRLQLFWLVHLGSQPHVLDSKSVMVIAPHQDDEVLGCGGLIALKRKAGIRVHIAFVTDGAASHADLGEPGGDLAAVRRKEALDAAAILGVDGADLHFLDRPDGSLRRLSGVERQATIGALAALLESRRPQELYVPHQHDRTDDHEATYELAMAALAESRHQAEVYQYAVWMLWNSLVFLDFRRAALAGARRLRIDAVQRQKELALLAHRSQWMQRGSAAGPVLQPGFLRRLCLPYEVYFQTPASSLAAAPRPVSSAAGVERPT